MCYFVSYCALLERSDSCISSCSLLLFAYGQLSFRTSFAFVLLATSVHTRTIAHQDQKWRGHLDADAAEAHIVNMLQQRTRSTRNCCHHRLWGQRSGIYFTQGTVYIIYTDMILCSRVPPLLSNTTWILCLNSTPFLCNDTWLLCLGVPPILSTLTVYTKFYYLSLQTYFPNLFSAGTHM